MERRILIYCRISRDDGLEHYEKIETQRDILINYCRNRNLGEIAKIILHDNISGRDNSRFDYLRKMIETNDINCIVIKDLSRLGRDMFQVLDFINYLEKRKVQLLFSHETIDEDVYPLISWFNQQRAKEDSEKIKKSMYFKMANGNIIFKPPYGYKVKNKSLERDSYASKRVEQIFELFVSGYGIEEICKVLKSADKMNKDWNSHKVKNILKNDFYCGVGRFGFNGVSDFKEPVIIENHHISIIEKEQFIQVQKIMNQKKEHRRNERAEGLFSGIIYCGKCGSKMYLRKRNGALFYVCNTYNQKGNSACTMHKVLENKLIRKTEDYLIQFFEKSVGNSSDLRRIQIEENEKKLEEYKKKIEVLTLDYEKNIIGKELFHKKYKIIEMETEKIRNINKIYTGELLPGPYLQLKRSFIALLFEKIIVFEPDEIKQSIYPFVSDVMFKRIYREGGILFIENSIL